HHLHSGDGDTSHLDSELSRPRTDQPRRVQKDVAQIMRHSTVLQPRSSRKISFPRAARINYSRALKVRNIAEPPTAAIRTMHADAQNAACAAYEYAARAVDTHAL